MNITELFLLITTYEVVKFGLKKIFGPQKFYMINNAACPCEFKSPNLFYKWKVIKELRKEGWQLTSKRALDELFEIEEGRKA